MKRTRHAPEQVVRKLRDADRMLAEQKSIAEIAKQLGCRRTRITAGATSSAG
jgi:AraC-like DNA-binding protein